MGRELLSPTAVSVTVDSFEYSSWWCSTHLSTCFPRSVMISPKVDFYGVILMLLKPKAFSIPSYMALVFPPFADSWML